jgi:hypothetical protein
VLETEAPSDPKSLELGWGLWRIAPLCEGFNPPQMPGQQVSGYSFMGERDKYLAVTPNRVVRLQCTEDSFFIQYQGGTHESVAFLVLDARAGITNGTITVIEHALDASGSGALRCSLDAGCVVEVGVALQKH